MLPLMYQTGYLTIKSSTVEGRETDCELGYPNGEVEEAMAQIEEKGYAAKYASDPRKVFKIGCAFDWEKRNLGQWLIA